MNDTEELDGLIDGLAEPECRRQAAARLAAALGCEDILLFVLDSETRAFLPAPGMPKTLRGGPRWRAYLRDCLRAGTREAEVDLPESATRRACGISTENALVVALGGSPDGSGMRLLARRMRVIGALLVSEHARRQQHVDVELAREGAARAHSLATALEAARSAAAELNAKLQDETSRKDEFLAMLAHELRNPLAPLVNSVELLRRAGDSLEASILRRVLPVMSRQLSQLTRLVNDLLDVSRVTRRAIKLVRETLPLSEVLQAACETAAPLIEAKGHRLVIHQAGDPIYVDGDRARLIQVFTNLLSNAAKYTDSGGLITVDSIVDGGRASVVVKDNGAGIPPEMLGLIFDLFTQVQSTLHRSEGGLGIGLTLARTLVELHGGLITAHSAGPGRGSTFVVSLPTARRAVVRMEVESGVSESQPTGRRARVLLVEDNADSVATMEQLLRHMGADTRVASTGEAALEIVQRFTPELVLLDIGLPGLSGYEVASQLRALLGGDVQLVALTGYGSPEDQARAHAAGFDEHLVKPAPIDALSRLLNSLASGVSTQPSQSSGA